MSNLQQAQELMLEKLQKLDKTIADEDRALTHLNKQAGNKLQKISQLKDERRKISDAYKAMMNDKSEEYRQQLQEQPVIGLTMREVK